MRIKTVAARFAVALLAGCLVLSAPTNAAAQAQVIFQDTQVVLAPAPDGGGIVANTALRAVLTASPRVQIPQGGSWSLDWAGSANLAAGHYEGRWQANAYVQSITFDAQGVPHLVLPAHFTFVMPGSGTLKSEAINFQTGLCPLTSTFVQVWHYSRIQGTGVFSGLTDLSGDATATVTRPCETPR